MKNKCPCCNQHLPQEIDKRRRKINWLENRIHEVKRLKQYTSIARMDAISKYGYQSPQLSLVIAVEELCRFIKTDANRKLESMGERRIK